MSETGATESQIEAAFARRMAARSPRCQSTHPRTVQGYRSHLEHDAAALVPPDHRIVPVADLERLLDGFDLYDPTFVERIRALIGGGR